MKRFAFAAIALSVACSGTPPPPGDPCTPNPCQHGGACSNSGGAAACACIAPYTGRTCAVAPSVTSIAVPATVTVGASTSLTAQLSDPGAQVTSVLWTFGDGSSATDSAPTRSGATVSSAASHAYASSGTFTVVVSVAFGGGATFSQSASVTVVPANADPCTPNPCQNAGTCTASGGAAQCTCPPPYTGSTCAVAPAVSSVTVPASVTAGTSAPFSAELSDPGAQVTSVLWTFGDGASATDAAPVRTGATVTSTTAHSYATAGSFTLTAAVQFGALSFSKTASVTVSAVSVDPCSPNPCQNAGSCANNGGVAACTCATGFTGSTCAQHLPTVTSLTPPSGAVAGSPASLSAAVNDPDHLVTAVSWTFGDSSGTSDTTFIRSGNILTSDVQHTYANAGTFTATASVTVGGITSSKTAGITVAPASGGCSVTSWNVTAPGFYYAFSGVTGQNPALTVCKGQTFTFHLQNVPAIHPFCIWNANDQNGAPGVTNNCASGTADVVWAVPANLTTGGQYKCDVHFFGNTFTVQ